MIVFGTPNLKNCLIDQCPDCRHYWVSDDDEICLATGKKIKDGLNHSIPNWCPLEDYK
jgi:hypothetical protein